jgi:hypothetical protein
MLNDPIVEEVHKVRDEIFKECGNDFGRFFEFIRKSQAGHSDRLITSLKKRSHETPTVSPTNKRG